jgi:Xaa-Pro dipeptidase
MFDPEPIHQALREFELDGWLLYDFRNSNVLARRVLGLDGEHAGSRRWACCLRHDGPPRKLVHRIESGALDRIPGETRVYLAWQEFEAGLAWLLEGLGTVATEYAQRAGNPYVSRIDAGTIELVRESVGQVVSSGDLVQRFEATWDQHQADMHFQAETITTSAFDMAWHAIAAATADGGRISETDVQQLIMDHYRKHQAVTYHPPIVARDSHSGNPHYETGTGSDTEIRQDDLVLIDQWCKLDQPRSVYSDLTRMGFVGTEVPESYADVFSIVARARDAAIQCVTDAFAQDRLLQGFEVDQACRDVIDAAGYGDAYIHRTGHSIGQEVHGNGANMDNLETHELRRVMSNTCFSIEPGIYLPEFGIRSEVNVYVDDARTVHVTGGPCQTEIVAVLGLV